MYIGIRVLLSLGLILIYLPLAVRRDDIATDLNGSLDTLKQRFHTLGALIRGLVFGVVGILAYYPSFSAILSYFVLSSLYFWTLFDPKLNVRDGKPKGYVSRDQNGALTDKFLVWVSKVVGKEPEAVAPVFKLVLLILSIILFVLNLIRDFRWDFHTPDLPT
jgi:hypothetical protein